MVFVIILLIVAAIVYFKMSGDSKSVKAAKAQKHRTPEQIKALRYFLNDGCLQKKVSDEEYDQMIQQKVASLNCRQRALNAIGLDEEELKEIEPVCFEGYTFDKAYGRKGKDGLWRSSSYEVTWIFFSDTQVYLYQYVINTDCDEKKEETNEYFYKDITGFNTKTVTEEMETEYDSAEKVWKTENVDSLKFALVVPGDAMYCSMKQNEATERAVKAMKSKLREKKNA